MSGKNYAREPKPDNAGRWPANLILDEEAGAALDQQTGTLKSGNNCKRTKEGNFLEHGGLGKAGDIQTTYGDSGGASRFFYCAKASRSERNAGCEQLEDRLPTHGISNEKGGLQISNSKLPKKNNHPTVKPLKLMEYLCKLTKTPTGGIVLDPFGGSGSTALACINTGRDYLIIEKDEHYCEIARARIKARAGQKGLFDGTF